MSTGNAGSRLLLASGGSGTGLLIGIVVIVVVLFLAAALFKRGDRRSRNRPVAEQEALVAQAFQRRPAGSPQAEVGIDLSRVSLPVDRIKEIAAENGYEYKGVTHNRMGEFLDFRLRGTA